MHEIQYLQIFFNLVISPSSKVFLPVVVSFCIICWISSSLLSDSHFEAMIKILQIYDKYLKYKMNEHCSVKHTCDNNNLLV